MQQPSELSVIQHSHCLGFEANNGKLELDFSNCALYKFAWCLKAILKVYLGFWYSVKVQFLKILSSFGEYNF